MIKSFRNDEAKAIRNGEDTKRARKHMDPKLWKIAQRKMDQLNAATRLEDLKSPSNQLEKLKDDMPGFHSIRINDKYRLVFRFDGGDAYDVDVLDIHG